MAPRRRVLLAGSTAYLRHALNTVEEAGLPVVGILSSGTPAQSPVGGRPHFGPPDVARGLPPALERERPEVLLSFMYLRLLPVALIERFDLALNVHPGPLPPLRGIHVFEYAILHDFSDYWVTCHRIAERFDEGDIVATGPVEIHDGDTVGVLYRRAMKRALLLLRQVAEQIASSESPSFSQRPQGFGTAVTKYYIEWASQPRAEDDDATLERKLRAACWDGRSAMIAGHRFPLGSAGVAAVRDYLRGGG